MVENRFLNSKEISFVSLKSKRSDGNEIFFTVEIVYFVQFNLSPLKIDVSCLYIYIQDEEKFLILSSQANSGAGITCRVTFILARSQHNGFDA